MTLIAKIENIVHCSQFNFLIKKNCLIFIFQQCMQYCNFLNALVMHTHVHSVHMFVILLQIILVSREKQSADVNASHTKGKANTKFTKQSLRYCQYTSWYRSRLGKAHKHIYTLFFNSFYWTKQINFHFSHIQIKTVLYSEQYFLLSNVFPGANRLLDISILPQNSNHLTKPLYNFYSTILAVHLKYQSTVIWEKP